jgi:hypothetical protein
MSIRVSAVLSTLFALASPLWSLSLEPLRGAAATLEWPASQYIQADAHGNVYLLRGDTLQVFPVTRSHELGEPVRLGPALIEGHLLDAAMSARGDWVGVLGTEVHYFVDGKEKAVLPPLPWFPAAVGFVRGDPVAVVVPPRLGDPSEGDDKPPVLLRSGHDSWSPELREALHGAAKDYNNEMLHRAALVLDEREGRYVLARQYAYRIERRRLGRERALEEVRLGQGKPRTSKRPEEDTRRLLAQLKSEGTDTQGAHASAFHGVFAILALAQGGPGERLYVLEGPGVAGERCALDRIDWELRRVERTALSLPCNGRMTMAAGRDGLYLARHSAKGGGRYFAPWAAVEGSRWTTVKEAEFSP